MLLDLVKQYPDLIQEAEVERFRIVGASYELRGSLLLKDGSRLFVKDYVFSEDLPSSSPGGARKPGGVLTGAYA